jgi:hypothetical protein
VNIWAKKGCKDASSTLKVVFVHLAILPFCDALSIRLSSSPAAGPGALAPLAPLAPLARILLLAAKTDFVVAARLTTNLVVLVVADESVTETGLIYILG